MSALSPLACVGAASAILVGGAYVAATLHGVIGAAIAGRPLHDGLFEPLRASALLLRQQATRTEHPDALLGALAPAVYASVSALALMVVPLDESVILADLRMGIVVFGAAEALAIVAVFLHGWSSNSHLALLGGFRFVALGLSYELLSMFVLIAAALPAESLEVSAIVDAQARMWNVVRQPLGFPSWLVVTSGVTFLGPLNLADGADLSTGTSIDASGRPLLLWEIARGGMLTVFCGMGAAVFLGGWRGPLLPGWAWMLLKTLVSMALVVGLGHRIGRLPAERAVRGLWTVGLPLAFLDLLLAGIEALA